MEVFFSYSHKDKEFHDALVQHLTPLQQEGKITTWHDQKIMPGDEWEKAIESHLESADIILLLISVDFVNSKYCYDIELKKALQRHEKGEARVIPVILRSVDWHNTPFGKFNALPTDGKAITLWPDRDAAFTNVVIGLRGAIEELRPLSTASAQPQNLPQSSPIVNDSKFLKSIPFTSVRNSQRIVRGGSWGADAWICRSANRYFNAASDRNEDCGLRVVAVASSTPSRQNF